MVLRYCICVYRAIPWRWPGRWVSPAGSEAGNPSESSSSLLRLAPRAASLIRIRIRYRQCCGAGAEGFLAGAGADLKFDLEPAPFLASEKWNDLKMLAPTYN